ncbi:TPA: phage tail tape measure protein [Neisseria meningitidis]|uniref:phage tail tape measure protein n=2 Tax=Neisseria meningitidis TaxID=487 RepID=UPI000D8B3D2A|nr:phage tail tape measure protein [Neisseria meningitidis]MBH2181529.1 phage tail tape measure protein [Neisseria meningitidis]MBH2224363.1 phage tail tape measure protein [Neisseria meningitidis]MBH2237511.1 phage tail tape measure protein [Neisseria meningitidis]MBH2402133.1 phage tail tape measure protein [Neisseria meningitidis]MBH2444948.1 phage tail tape measure protein [Neisseria meningitidis]
MTSKTISIILKAADKASTEFKRIGQAASGLGGHIANARNEQIRLTKAIHDTKRLQDYRNNLGETAKKLAENRARQKELLAEMKKGGGATRQQTQEMNKLAREAKNLEKTQARQTKTAARLAKEMKAAGTSTVKLADSQKDLKTKLEKVNGTLEKQKKILEARNKAAVLKAGLGDAATRSATMMYTARGIADTTRNVLSAPVAAYAQSETASTDLRAAMMDSSGKVGADYQRIDELATRLGDKLPGTTADFKNLMTMLMRQGISAKAVLGGTGEAAALLSVQLKKSPEAAAEMAAKLQDATRGTEKEMVAIMDQVQRLYYLGVDDGNILGAFSTVAPALDLMKVSGEEAMKTMGPLIAMLDQSGMTGEKAGNALRKVFDRSLSVDKFEKLKKLTGVSLDFTDGKGNFAGLDKAFDELAKLKNLTDVQLKQVLGKVWGDDAETIGALTTMIRKGKEGYEEYAQKMQAQASLNQRVNDQLGTLTNLWDAASGTFTNFLAKMGESIAPQLKELTKWIGGINEKLSDWAAKNPQTAAAIMKTAAVIGIVLTAVVGLGAALSALLIPVALSKFAFFSLFGGMGKAAGGALGLAGTLLKLGGSLAAFGAKALVFLATNPFGWAILAVGALVMLWRNWDTVKSALIAGWEWVKKVFGGQNPIAVAISAAVNPIGTLIANFNRLKNAAGGAWEWIKKTTGIGSPTPAAPKTTAPKAPIVPPRGFSTGGYTGAGGVHEAAGIVHKGEVVFNQKDVARFGGWQVLDKIRKAGLDALGGLLPVAAPVLAGAIPVATDFNRAAPASAPAAGMTVNITVNGGSGSPAEIAREIARQLKQTADQAARRARSAFKDR